MSSSVKLNSHVIIGAETNQSFTGRAVGVSVELHFDFFFFFLTKAMPKSESVIRQLDLELPYCKNITWCFNEGFSIYKYLTVLMN